MKEKSQSIELLQIYRDRVKSKYEKPGWNRWVLLGGLASLLWIMLSPKLIQALDLEKFLLIVLIAYITESIFISVQSKFTRSMADMDTKYILLKDVFSNNIHIFIFELILDIVLLLSVAIIINVEDWFKIFLIVILLSKILNHIIILFLALTNIPLPTNIGVNKKKSSNLTQFLKYSFYIGILIDLIILSKLTSLFFLIFNLILLKWLLLLYSFLFIIKLMLRAINDPLINKIDQMTDEVVFNNLSYEEVLVRLKLILFGLDARGSLSPLIDKYLSLNQRLETECRDVVSILNKIEHEKSETNMSEDLKLINIREKKIKLLISKIDKYFLELKTKINVIMYLGDKDQGELIFKELLDENKRKRRYINDVIQKINKSKNNISIKQ